MLPVLVNVCASCTVAPGAEYTSWFAASTPPEGPVGAASVVNVTVFDVDASVAAPFLPEAVAVLEIVVLAGGAARTAPAASASAKQAARAIRAAGLPVIPLPLRCIVLSSSSVLPPCRWPLAGGAIEKGRRPLARTPP